MSKTIAKVAALLAVVALIASSFAVGVGAQTTNKDLEAQIAALMAQIAALQAQTGGSSSASMTFTRDLTIGSTGADVTALQNWLINGGYAIAAGATGYFGAQTQAALASYQAANMITPAAGYFGPVTRARVNVSAAPAPAPAPSTPDEDEDNDYREDDERDEAEEMIEGARESLDDARDEVADADDDGEDIDEAEDLLDEAEELIDEAEEAFDDEEYDEVMGLIKEAQNLIEEALEEIEAEDSDTEASSVETSARVNERDGADNDTATFKIQVELSALNQDVYIDRDTSVSVAYEIQDASRSAVAGATSNSSVLQSSADRDGDYYVIAEGDDETFTLTVTFDPLAIDEGEQYLLQLLSINFNAEAASPDREWNARPESRYQTDYVYIGD